MNTIMTLQTKAVTAAKNLDWTEAEALNREILELDGVNIGAMIRLAVALVQLEENEEARGVLNRVLELEPRNSLAIRHLENLDKKKSVTPNFTNQHFIEEPSKSKIVRLHRLTDKNTLEELMVGTKMMLRPKSHLISVETMEKVYIGSLPDDVSRRLADLIAKGNEYDVQVHSLSRNHCDVYLREKYQSAENRGKLSFPAAKGHGELGADIDDEFLVENNLPMELGAENEYENEEEGVSGEDLLK